MIKNQPYLWIFANGEIPDPDRIARLIESGAICYAADGGLRHLNQLSRKPVRLIGDLDSVEPDEVERQTSMGVIVERFPIEKDETDLELALDRAIGEGFRHIRIAGGLGGRLDQTIANLFLLQRPTLADMDVRFDDGLEEVFLIHEFGEIHGTMGDTLSLIPLNGPAHGIVTQGLKYPLCEETLFPDHTRGISNEMLGERATVHLHAGTLLCVHRRM